MNYTYILECEDGSFYTGWTNDLEKRYKAHCEGKGAKYTKAHKPVRIAYYEMFEDRIEAMQREYALKQLDHKAKKQLADAFDSAKVQIKKKEIKTMKIVRCKGCGKIAFIAKDSACPTKCCGEPMEELTANTTDASQEKHVPAISREGGKVVAHVGSVDHPMIPEHYIEFIVLETEKGFRVAYLNPGEKPEAVFYSEEPVTAVYGYCNLHGLWKTSV